MDIEKVLQIGTNVIGILAGLITIIRYLKDK